MARVSGHELFFSDRGPEKNRLALSWGESQKFAGRFYPRPVSEIRDPQAHINDSRGYKHGHGNGMTKKEFFLCAALKAVAIMYKPDLKDDDVDHAKEIVKLANILTDEMFKQLKD